MTSRYCYALYSLAAAVLGVVVLKRTLLRKRARLPKGFRAPKPVDTKPRPNTVPPNRDRFAVHKIPKDLDVIVVGSGIGGLTCAAYLSRVGYKVLVLEQHYLAGGCTHAFMDQEFEFETGIHYIGNIEKRTPLLEPITCERIQWAKMGGSDPENMVYDEFYIENKKYSCRSGLKNFVADMKALFPGEAAAIDKYVELVQYTARKELFFEMKIVRPQWLRTLLVKLLCREFFRLVGQTTYDVIRSFTSNEELIAVLCGQWGDCGRPPKQMSFFMHASVVNHYFEGGCIEGKAGGLCSKVGRILVDPSRRRAYGVEMKNEQTTQIFAPIVVSNVGLVNTYSQLLTPTEVAPFPFERFLKDVGISKTQIFVFVGLNGTSEELGLRNCNTWIWPNKDYDEMEKQFEANFMEQPIPLFLACGSAKDPSWPERHPGRSTAMIVAFGKMDWFRKWVEEPQGNRGEDYEQLKENFAQRMLEQGLFRVYPKCKGRVEFVKVGTPCSVKHFLGYTEGEVYGLNVVPARFQQNITPDTHLDGLYLTGQDVTTTGFTGAMMAGILTAHSILGYGTILDILQNRNLVRDLMYADSLEKSEKQAKS